MVTQVKFLFMFLFGLLEHKNTLDFYHEKFHWKCVTFNLISEKFTDSQ